MNNKETLVCFIWHMHQPDYGLPGQNRNLLPWVRLHATKAYLDLPWMLERYPKVKACINLSGSLVKQIVSYVEEGRRDIWWDLSLRHPSELNTQERLFLLEHFFSINWDRHIKPRAPYWSMLQKRGHARDKIQVDRFSDRELLDLQVHFNLAWTGFAARHEHKLVQDLLARGSHFTQEDKLALLGIQIDIMGQILPRYRALAEKQQIELTTTPLYHPILPLLVDSDVTKRCQPDRDRPRRFAWPQDATWHIKQAYQQHKQHLGQAPLGMWPAEGSVSPEVLPLFAKEGVRWIASDEDTLMKSSPRSHGREDALYRPYRLETEHGPIHMVFRDHMLSDLIGFTYAHNDAKDAAQDLLGRVREGGQRAGALQKPLVSLILDGENPWESYLDDGEHFQRELYEALSRQSDLRSVRICDYLEEFPDQAAPLHHLHSGSWIMGNYQIWIGAEETNTAWNLLGEARSALEEARQGGQLPEEDLERAQKAIYAAQGSDWFWWYGEDFTCDHDAEFDSLFRGYLREVYRALHQRPPQALNQAIGHPQLHTEVAQPRQLIHPSIEGVAGHFYKWVGAGHYEPHGGAGSMFRAHSYIKALYFGFDLQTFYLRLDPGPDWNRQDQNLWTLHFLLRGGDDERQLRRLVFRPECDDRFWLAHLDDKGKVMQETEHHTLAWREILELGISFEALGLKAGQACGLSLVILREGIEIDRHPAQGTLRLTVPDASFESRHWMV